MKQKFIASFISLCLVFLASIAYGQRATVSSDQATGTFRISAASPEGISVRYSLAPAYPDNIVLQLMSGSEFVLNAHVTDAKSHEVLQIKQETVGARYANSIDISKLVPGQYFIEVHNSNGENAHRIPFNVGTK
jgi:hypothetical protein